MKISHCSECGSPYTNPNEWPRACTHCDVLRWQNPVPVVAVMQPVLHEGRIGLVVAKRAIQPALGQWALIGGFMNICESMEDGARREFREETSIELAGMPKLAFNTPVGNGGQLMLMTHVDNVMEFEVFEKAKPCPENEEIGLFFADDQRTLAFPTHRDAAAKFFAGEYNDVVERNRSQG